MVSAECMGRPQGSTPQRCSTACSVYLQCVLEGCVIEIQFHPPNHDTESRTSVAMHNATVQPPLTTESPNLNPTIMMLQAKVGFISKHNVVQFHCPFLPFIAPLVTQTPLVSSQG
ncbi:hypothetical protein TNCV_4940061 [Trichonephila clavipes]|nr:hypothetical protein TNCV_4940061 [Trichonephila clavipes]